ncbi:uncharacterized protein PAC_05315 [Phialocephala subalpina]|uniref:Uncharacterized protein n=1 Tax=Phialocephala subalpina TaxID=576137 RepID=A0A1L7WRP3_9HELO|nr:uncharacterized protein PAC_05315 [Phialocephala subalpina]
MAPSLDSNGSINGHVDHQAIHDIKNGINGLSVQRFDYETSEFSEKNDLEVRRLDEYDVDFSDTRTFSVLRWADTVKTSTDRLTASDLQIASKYTEWQDLASEIQAKLTESPSTPLIRRQIVKIQPLPHALASLTRKFSNLVTPEEVNFEIIWGLVYLNLKLSYLSIDRLKRTSDLLNKLRRLIELFTRCLDSCEEANESRIAAVDFLDPLIIILTDSIVYLHDSSSDREAEEAWPDLNESINSQLESMDLTVKHVNEITIQSKANLDRQARALTQRHTLAPDSEEKCSFPNRILPFQQNTRFYGRKEELDKIYDYLSPKGDGSYRTYTIYGRRGVGKTEIALQFAYTNPAGYDAIFWIQCETSVTIRQSFTDVAVSLELPGADRDGHHEENLLAVKDWLSKTRRRWLLIFDNAENDQILKGYWPTASSGAILLTSRKYFNFTKDTRRKGDTVKPFDTKQSWELLLQLLGDDWKRLDLEGKIAETEIIAAKHLLEKLEGLALAIQQAAILIKDSEVGGPTIVKTLERFKERIRTLPARLSSTRSTAETALDALWDMSFSKLSRDARTLLQVLAWLSPDKIPINLFLPRAQSTLDGPLEFCKKDAKLSDEGKTASLYTLVNPSPQLEAAIKELSSRALIKEDSRNFGVHRVVQEATNFQNSGDLQSSFDAAVNLVWYRFPKREMDENLYTKWSECQEFVSHGVYLSRKFQEYARSGALKGTDRFVELLSNCAWYIYELGDFDVSKKVVEIAILSCENKDSLLYAELRSTAGSLFYDLNQLDNCRQAWDEALRIRESKLPQNSPHIAAIFNNLGNAELAQGNIEDSMDYFNRAIPIWKAEGDKTATHLALTYLCVGRSRMIAGDLNEAMKWTSQSDALFMRTIGSDKGFMANVHYAFGNIHFRQRHLASAHSDYEMCLKICLPNMPIHPLTAAAYFSLACVELEMEHVDLAKAFLAKAKAIAELRSPNRDDGPIARILWKTAVVLEGDTFGKYADEAKRLRQRAETAQQSLFAAGEGGEIPKIDENRGPAGEEEDSYRALVPLFYR